MLQATWNIRSTCFGLFSHQFQSLKIWVKIGKGKNYHMSCFHVIWVYLYCHKLTEREVQHRKEKLLAEITFVE